MLSAVLGATEALRLIPRIGLRTTSTLERSRWGTARGAPQPGRSGLVFARPGANSPPTLTSSYRRAPLENLAPLHASGHRDDLTTEVAGETITGQNHYLGGDILGLAEFLE